jgi:hypothetical protein
MLILIISININPPYYVIYHCVCVLLNDAQHLTSYPPSLTDKLSATNTITTVVIVICMHKLARFSMRLFMSAEVVAITIHH